MRTHVLALLHRAPPPAHRLSRRTLAEPVAAHACSTCGVARPGAAAAPAPQGAARAPPQRLLVIRDLDDQRHLERALQPRRELEGHQVAEVQVRRRRPLRRLGARSVRDGRVGLSA